MANNVLRPTLVAAIISAYPVSLLVGVFWGSYGVRPLGERLDCSGMPIIAMTKIGTDSE